MRAPGLGLLVLATVWLAALAVTDGMTALLVVAPLFAVLLPLAMGRYPLEGTLERLRGTRHVARRALPAARRYVPRPRPQPAWLLDICTGTRGPPR